MKIFPLLFEQILQEEEVKGKKKKGEKTSSNLSNLWKNYSLF